MADVWGQLTTEEAEAGFVAADVLAVWRWWLEETWLVLVCQLVKTAAVCQSACSSSQTENFLRSLKVLTCCAGLLHL